MGYRWLYHAGGQANTAGPDSVFDSQDDAESWLGENWPGLLETGIDQVTLLEDETEVYGPMSLRAE